MAVELAVKQKPYKQAIRGPKGEVLMEVMATSVNVGGITLALHAAVVSVGGKTVLAEKGGLQLTEPRTGHRFCGGERTTKMSLMAHAENLIKQHGPVGIEKIVEDHLSKFSN